jgi:protein-tyrosine phosphatase
MSKTLKRIVLTASSIRLRFFHIGFIGSLPDQYYICASILEACMLNRSLFALLGGAVLVAAFVWPQPAPMTPSQAVKPMSVSQADWAVPVDKSFNLYRMSPTLYRSALPDTHKLPVLQSLQVHTVLSFIKDNDATWLGQTPIRRLNIPLHADRVDDADVLRVLRTLQEAEKLGPVLMHCKHGRDRTGLMAAMYRTVIQGWSKDDAISEMRDGGFGDVRDMTDAIHYVEQADIARIRQALVAGECSTKQLSTCKISTWIQGLLASKQAA